MPALKADERLLAEAIESLTDRGALGFERHEEGDNFIYEWSHARARQHKDVLVKYRDELLHAVELTFRVKRLLAEVAAPETGRIPSSIKPLPDSTGSPE